MTDQEQTTPNFRKDGNARVADFTTLTAVEIDLIFEQRKGGAAGWLRNKVRPADPDLVGAVFAGTKLCDSVDPKERKVVFEGLVEHLGDARGAGSETIRAKLTSLLAEDDDIDGLAFGAYINDNDGFSRTAGMVVKVYDTSSGSRVKVGVVRFDVDSRQTGVAIATLRRVGAGWQLRSEPTYGHARAVPELNSMLRRAMS